MSNMIPGVELSNFRLSASFPDWPLGGSRRGLCTFTHERNKRGQQRILRTTTGKPKASTYYPMICVADGSDGRVHLVALTDYGFIYVRSSDMQHAERTVHADAEPELYAQLVQSLKAVCIVDVATGG